MLKFSLYLLRGIFLASQNPRESLLDLHSTCKLGLDLFEVNYSNALLVNVMRIVMP